MKVLLVYIAGLLGIILIVFVALALQRQPDNNLVGVDVSWPNCKANPSNAAFGIVGVTGGLDFSGNDCLRSEAAWFSAPMLYMNSGWPGTDFHLQFKNSPRRCHDDNSTCLAYNYGFHAAQYALSYADSQLVHINRWWIDVETDNSWTSDIQQNQAAIKGMINAVKQNVLEAKVGIYSYPGQWEQLVGSWRPALPAWVATGGSDRSLAIEACNGASFTAGTVTLAQYTSSLDQDLACF
jgi:hypothetical protein